MPTVTYFSVLILLVFGRVKQTLCYKMLFRLAVVWQCTPTPLVHYSGGGKSNCVAPTMCTLHRWPGWCVDDGSENDDNHEGGGEDDNDDDDDSNDNYSDGCAKIKKI